jgi:hypothetical protein
LRPEFSIAAKQNLAIVRAIPGVLRLALKNSASQISSPKLVQRLLNIQAERNFIMKNRTPFFTTFLACSSFIILSAGVNHSGYAEQKNIQTVQQAAPGKINGKITEVINASGYTYAEVDTGKEKIWAAGPVTPLKVGDMIAFTTEMPMDNFHSQSMDRDFSKIYFVSKFLTGKETSTNMSGDIASPHTPFKQLSAAGPVTGISKVKGGHTIAEIHTNKEKLNGKTVHVRGKITKITTGVLGKNWLHIVDSSTLDDLTVTTDSSAAMGDVVVAEGKLGLNKDFGYGYVYPVILEDAKITQEKTL